MVTHWFILGASHFRLDLSHRLGLRLLIILDLLFVRCWGIRSLRLALALTNALSSDARAMLDASCVALLCVEGVGLTICFVDIGGTAAHGAKSDCSFRQTLGKVLNIGLIVRLHLEWLRVETIDSLSAFDLGEIHDTDLLSVVLRVTMRHVYEWLKSAFISSRISLKDGVLDAGFVHVERRDRFVSCARQICPCCPSSVEFSLHSLVEGDALVAATYVHPLS